MLPLSEVASQLATTELHVLMHIKKGLLQAQEIEGQWYVNPETLAEFQRCDPPSKSSILQCKGHCGGCSGGA
jgi:hypothetical protein